MDAPAIEDVGDVDDLLRLFGGAQDEVVVLRDREGLVPAADRAQQLGAKAHEVDDVRVRAQELGRERRPVGVAHHLVALVGDEDLVGIDHVRVVLEDRLGHAEERVLLEDVVMVHEHHVLARGQRERAVRGARDAAVFGGVGELDALVDRGELLHVLAHVGHLRAVVGEAELPVRIELLADREQHLPEHVLVRVVDRAPRSR
jgi:hypothetical protein